jgi:lipopolysaccharide biosynthesis glycosyltransferase
MRTEKKAIYTCSDEKYVIGTRALLVSAANAYPDVERFCFVPEAQVEEIARKIRDIGTVLPAPRELKNVPQPRQMMAARVFGVTLPADIVLYMDSDVIVCRPGEEIWNVEGKDVRAVMDPAKEMFYNLPGGEPHWQQFRDRFPGRVGHHGINSGVFALRPEYWSDLPERFEAAIEKFSWTQVQHFADQPFLGALFLPCVKPLPFSYNAHFSFEIPIPRDVHHLHFTGIKPWNPDFPHHERAWFFWCKYGQEPCPGHLSLALSGLWAWINTPRCFISRLRHRSSITARIVDQNPQYGVSS